MRPVCAQFNLPSPTKTNLFMRAPMHSAGKMQIQVYGNVYVYRCIDVSILSLYTYIYIYMHMCIYVCTYVHMYIGVHVFMHVYACVYVFIYCIYIYILCIICYICYFIYIYYIYIIYMYVCIYVSICIRF